MISRLSTIVLACVVAFTMALCFGQVKTFAVEDEGVGLEEPGSPGPGEGDEESEGLDPDADPGLDLDADPAGGDEDDSDSGDTEPTEGLSEADEAIEQESGPEDAADPEAPYIMDVARGKTLYLPLEGKGVLSFEGVSIKAIYDPGALRLLDAAAHMPGKYSGAGPAGAELIIKSWSEGEVVFAFNKDIPPGNEWSGLITMLMFEGLIDGETLVTVSWTPQGKSAYEEENEAEEPGDAGIENEETL